jgi:hypothetical protein
MDREARTSILEADPTFGMLRDPMIKVAHVMRSLEYQSPIGREIYLGDLMSRIGVQAMMQRSVFGYYLPDFQPAGPVMAKGLYSPASQLATPPMLLNYLNGLTSLIDNGLTECDSGFGSWLRDSCAADGTLNYTVQSSAAPVEIVDDLGLLLAAGRLETPTKDYAVSQYSAVLNSTKSSTLALKQAMKILITSREFNSNSIPLVKNSKRPYVAPRKSNGRRLKSLVVVFERGGSDSWNRIVPLSNCSSKDLYAEYAAVRTISAIAANQLLPITVPGNNQPCGTFGVHPAFSNLQSLYNSGDAAFIANVGSLIEPVRGEFFFF